MSAPFPLILTGEGTTVIIGPNGSGKSTLLMAMHGTARHEIMYNDFVIIAPATDPAQVASSETATEALQAIYATAAPFVSRGDDSGTHLREIALWNTAGLLPEAEWYKSVAAGMGAAVNTAAALDAYILSDRASWLNFGNRQGLSLLFAGDPALFNQYADLPVNPDCHPHVASTEAKALQDWLLSPKARDLISGYQIDGQQLFTFNGQLE